MTKIHVNTTETWIQTNNMIRKQHKFVHYMIMHLYNFYKKIIIHAVQHRYESV